MAELFDPRYQAQDANGLPYAGATLTFYQAGTTTKITIYSDQEATTPRANPVTADATGSFPPIYISGPDRYKFILQSAAGVTLDTADDVGTFGTDGSIGNDQLAAEAVTIDKLNAALISIMGWSFDELADLEATEVSPEITSVRVKERVTGKEGGAFWSRQTSEPDVPDRAKTQDDAGAWWMLEPENGTVTPEMFGAVGGIVIESETRDIFDDIETAGHAVHERHLRIIDDIVRRFKRTECWADVEYTVGTGGLLTWDGSALTGVKEDAYDFIVEFYEVFAPHILTEGRSVTDTELDAVAAISANTTTDAFHDLIEYCSHGRAKGVLSPVTYVINETLRPRFAVTLDGTKGLSRIRMDSSIGYNVPVLQTGDVDEPAFDIFLSNFIVDANYDRLAGSAGLPTSGTPRGTAVCISFTNHARLKGMEAYDAFKHCFDATGATYGSSGVAGTVNAYPEQISYDVIIEDCWQEGCGDDGFTTHSCRKVLIKNCTSMFTTANFTGVTSNSNAYEADDFSLDVRIESCYAAFAYKAIEIKGHADAAAARNVVVDGLEAYKCEVFANIQHIGFGDIGSGETRSASAHNVTMSNLVFRHPINWLGGGLNCAMRILSYTNVDINGFRILQEGADDDYFGTDSSDGGILIFWEGRNVTLRGVEFDGFAASYSAIRVTATSAGYLHIFGLTVTDGPLNAIHHSGTSNGAKTTLNNYALEATAGTKGIIAATALFKNGGEAWISGYSTATDIT